MPDLNSLKAAKLNLEGHLETCYTKCRTIHTSSWKSWGKSLFRRGNRGDTGVEATGHAATVGGTVTGAVGLTTGAAATAIGAGTAAAVVIYALPLVITAVGIAYWGYNKNQKNSINQEIWNWWYDNKGDSLAELELAGKDITQDKLVVYLSWFGDVGISNMAHLKKKIEEAKKTFDKKTVNIDRKRESIDRKIRQTSQLTDPKEKAKKINILKREVDSCAEEAFKLGVDHQYLTYRLQRHKMYHQMLSIVTKNYADKVKATNDALDTAMTQAAVDNKATYEQLIDNVTSLPRIQ